MMSKADPHSSAKPVSGVEPKIDAAAKDDWHQLEVFVDQLQESAHSPIEVNEFYRELLDGCVTLLAAAGGVVWLPETRGRWNAAHQINRELVLKADDSAGAAVHFELLRNVASVGDSTIVQPHSGGVGAVDNPTDFVLALAAVGDTSQPTRTARVHAIVELFLRPGSSPAVQQGVQQLLEAVSSVAAEFHVHQQLRELRSERGMYDQSLALIRRLQQTSELREVAFEIANEGRRFVGADRLSVIVKQGAAWKLLAASGVDRVEPRADVTKRLQALAAATSDWGEPIEYVDAATESTQELPPKLTKLVEQHVDESQARKLVATPIQFVERDDDRPQAARAVGVLVAEQFTTDEGEFSRQRVLELAGLSEPALSQALQLDRFPLRSCLRWANRWEHVREKWGLTKVATATLGAIAVVAALTLVRVDYEVEAPGTLRPIIERDIFATTDGKVTDVRIAHGDSVAAGDVLAILHDPQLLLDVQRVDGEIETTRKRLESIAVARTDRQVREEINIERLPLAAEAEQLEKRLASLETQQEILARRHDMLTLRSPVAGIVLTLDVQNLLRTRPVERGQVLFTVADDSAGWLLLAELPQNRIGQVAAAKQQSSEALPVRFRIMGEPERTFTGHVEAISTTAVLDTDGLDEESPAFEVKVAVDNNEQLLARPGMSAEVRILCGRRSLGYVWLHDVWETVYSWVVF